MFVAQNWPDAGVSEYASSDIASAENDVKQAMLDAQAEWAKLDGCYDTPHEDLLQEGMADAVSQSDAVIMGAKSTADALLALAEDLSILKPRRDNLSDRIGDGAEDLWDNIKGTFATEEKGTGGDETGQHEG
ncbi:MAG: hypothetical protein ACK5KO_01790 [Arachnia sp.]